MSRMFLCSGLLLLAGWSAPVWGREVRFSVTCDNRTSTGFSDVLSEINLRSGGPGEFMISPGDIDRCADTRARLDAGFGVDFLWYPVVGNHELPGAGSETYSGENMEYLRGYDYGTVNPGPSGCVETTYSFDAGPIHIACINEYWDGGTAPGSDVGTDGNVVQELRQWLATDLAATDRKWKLVFGHEPAYPQPDEDWLDVRHEYDSLNKYPTDRDAFWSLLEQHDVVAYVCGHTHRFSHYRPPGSDVWQIDAAQARGIGKYDAFVIVTADDDQIQFETYRSLETAQFFMTDSWMIPEPASGSLLLIGFAAALRKRTRR